MLRGRALCVAVALVLGAEVASAQSVHTEHDPSFNVSAYRTYHWAKTDPVPGNDILKERIMSEVDAAMARRGWTKAPADQADLAVVVNVTTQPASAPIPERRLDCRRTRRIMAAAVAPSAMRMPISFRRWLSV